MEVLLSKQQVLGALRFIRSVGQFLPKAPLRICLMYHSVGRLLPKAPLRIYLMYRGLGQSLPAWVGLYFANFCLIASLATLLNHDISKA